MNTEREFDRIVAAWLSDGPGELTDRVLDAALDEVHVTRQRPRPVRSRRARPMTSTRAWILGIAATVAIVVAGGTLFLVNGGRQPDNGGVPSTSPSPAASASPVASPSAAASVAAASPSVSAGCERVLVADYNFGGLTAGSEACRYRSTVYQVPLTFGPPQGRWFLATEEPRYLQLNARNTERDSDNSTGIGITTVDRLIDQPCQPGPTVSAPATTPFVPSATGKGPDDLFAWLKAKGLTLSGTKPVTIGGRAGLDAIVPIPDGGIPGCPSFFYTTTDDRTPPGGQGFGGGQTHLIVLDADGTTVAIQVWAAPDRLATFTPIADDLIAGLRFP